MSCETCGHTMHRLCIHDDMTFNHCPRCGTVKVEIQNSLDRIYIPRLVERCREFGMHIKNRSTETNIAAWRTTGIAESIHKPEERETP